METFLLEFHRWPRCVEKPEVSPFHDRTLLWHLSRKPAAALPHQPLLPASDEAVIPLKAEAETVAIFSFESK